MYSITTRYEEVAVRAERKGRCPGCAKRVVRSRTFTMTISPFNKNPDGTVRTPAEVRKACSAKAAEWQPSAEDEVFRHAKC